MLADGLGGAPKAACRDAGEHPLEHDPAQRIAVGEVRVGGERNLALTVSRAHPRSLDRSAATAERHLPGLAAVADSRALGVVLSVWSDDLVDLLAHQLVQHAEPDADRQREQPLLCGAGQLTERLLHPFGQLLEAVLLADRVGILLYAMLSSSVL